MRPSRTLMALGVVSILFGISCGKRHVDPNRETEDGLERWDPPTAQFGFHPVLRAECLPASVGQFTASNRTTLEEVALRKDRMIRSITSQPSLGDGSGGAIYFTESTPRRTNDEHGSVHVATRLRGTDKWQVTTLATNEIEPEEIAINARTAFWVSKNLLTETPSYNIRFVGIGSSDHRIVETLSPETDKPSRLITHGRHVFWIAGNHIREMNTNDRLRGDNPSASDHASAAHGAPPPVDHASAAPGTPKTLPVVMPSPVHERYTGTLTPGLLAADDEAVYAFNGDHSLLRIPLAGGPATVLVSTTKTPPIDLAIHGSWVYWLEQGTEIVRCGPRGSYPCRASGYELKSARSHHGATLRRVPIAKVNGGTIGAIEDVATDLTDVERLTIHPRSGAISLTTVAGGAIRISPTGRLQDHTEYATVHPQIRMTTYGDALVVADTRSTPDQSKLVLLHSF